MKIVSIGDTHGRKTWRDIIEADGYDADLIIFHGDYTYSNQLITSEQQIEEQENILQYKEDYPDKVILLIGNHDLYHLGFYWAECNRCDYKVQKWLMSQRERFLSLAQMVYIHDNMVFSHAGISTAWMENCGIKTIQEINELPMSEIFGFTSDRISDCHGYSKIQPPVWIRPESLCKYMVPGYTQIVGHTPVKHILNFKEYTNKDIGMTEDLWLVDTMNTEYLVIENLQFITKTI